MQKICQRCSSDFTCLTNDIAHCACSSIQLSSETKTYLAKTKYNCLCNNCLKEFNQILKEISQESVSNSVMIEGLDYYYEGPYKVMTEYFHIKRGFCCGSGCRHCAY
ncbi:MAG: cysteine-rich CWC family protein [Chitinophagales bacterium]|nr:cysteine-rich CWC family protein [Chitinophagales bacterium]